MREAQRVKVMAGQASGIGDIQLLGLLQQTFLLSSPKLLLWKKFKI